MFQRRFILSIILVCVLNSIKSQPLLWNIKNINGIKENKSSKLYKQIIQKADKFVDETPINITDKSHQFVSDTHYYVSIGTYWWPDSTNINGKYIRRDGYINPETKNYDRVKLNELAERLKYLSLAYYLDHGNKYYTEFVELLRVWFCDNSTYMYPNFEYAQVVPGYNGNRGRAAGLIEARSFIDILESVRVIELVKEIDWGTLSTIKWWFFEFSKWMMESDIGIEEDRALNNQGTAYDLILLNIAQFTNQKELANKITDNFYQRRLYTQIAEDGSMPQELKRTNSLSYSILNIQFIIDFCVIQHNLGQSYYNLHKGIIDKAISFLQKHLNDDAKWPYEQLTSIKYEKKRLGHEMVRLKQIDRDGENHVDDLVKSFLSVDEMLR